MFKTLKVVFCSQKLSLSLGLQKLGSWVLLSLSCINVSGQHFSIAATQHIGTIIKHSPKITIQSGHLVLGQEINFRFQTTGRRDWEIIQRYPVFGLSLSHFSLGERAHGEAFALCPNLAIQMFSVGQGRAMFQFGTGIVWVSEPYHFINNASENAIGSHWNNTAQFSWLLEMPFHLHWRSVVALSFTHFSNGGTILPNFGVNIPALSISVAGAVTPYPKLETRVVDKKKVIGRRWGGSMMLGYTRVESQIVLNGPRYPLRMASGALTYQLNRVNRLMLGLDYEFNEAVRAWGLHSTTFPDEVFAKKAATRLAIWAGDEFRFGDLGVHLQMSFYVGKSFNAYTLNDFYNKLGLRYYLPRLPVLGVQPHIGIYLKAHKTIAEYIALNVGLSF